MSDVIDFLKEIGRVINSGYVCYWEVYQDCLIVSLQVAYNEYVPIYLKVQDSKLYILTYYDSGTEHTIELNNPNHDIIQLIYDHIRHIKNVFRSSYRYIYI